MHAGARGFRQFGLLIALLAVIVAMPARTGAVGNPFASSRVPLPPGAIHHVMVIDLENESFGSTFGANSPAVYLNRTLVPMGELVENYYATGHVSLDNYIAQVSGQASTPLTNSDCVTQPGFVGKYLDVVPGNDDPNPQYAGQVDGDGCVYPAPTATRHGAPTIADQLDARYPPNHRTHVASWREYAQDMGNDPTRDGGTPDPLGGTDCAHPDVGGVDHTETATATDQYANRHNPFIYFHSIIDDSAECNANVVPLGSITVGTPSKFGPVTLADSFTGHLAQDLRTPATTPKFSFVTPNLCNDGHDQTCAGTNTEGGKTGGLVGADLWLKHWMPLIFASAAYRSGQLLVVVTFDEASIADTTACCNEQPGPNWAFPGHSPLLGPPGAPGSAPGGGKVGAVLLNARYIAPGTRNTTGQYNHYSGVAQLRGPSQTRHRRRRRPWTPRIRSRTRPETVRHRCVQHAPLSHYTNGRCGTPTRSPRITSVDSSMRIPILWWIAVSAMLAAAAACRRPGGAARSRYVDSTRRDGVFVRERIVPRVPRGCARSSIDCGVGVEAERQRRRARYAHKSGQYFHTAT